jgi:hypothetical protein
VQLHSKTVAYLFSKSNANPNPDSNSNAEQPAHSQFLLRANELFGLYRRHPDFK